MSNEAEKNFEAFLNLNTNNIENVIHDLWLAKDRSEWAKEPYFFVKLGDIAYKLGQSMFAHDILQEGMAHFPGHLRITQLYALSLIKCGFLGKARELLTRLVVKGQHYDEETLGILGRVYKDMWLITGGCAGKDPNLLKSRNLYFKAFQKSKGYYSGINAASLSLIIGERAAAEKLTRVVLKKCLQLIKIPADINYWIYATLGEGFLLLGDHGTAAKYFNLAKEQGIKNYSDHASTLRQLRLLSSFINVPEELFNVLRVPPIVAFTGHMLDFPGRKQQRFPPAIAGRVKEEIGRILDSLNAAIGYSSAACGSDTLFLECLQKRKGESNIILPFDREDFFETSVDFAGPEWTERAKIVLANAPIIIKATDGKYAGDDLLFSYANYMIMGKALLRGRLLETDPVLLAVWDGRKKALTGGTADFVKIWESKKLPIRIIDINRILKEFPHKQEITLKVPVPTSSKQRRVLPERFKNVKRAVKVMLFADLVGYSRLREDQFPYFLNNFLVRLADDLKHSSHKPVFQNIWGDALYFVFDEMIPAAEYALDLRDFVRKTDWREMGLPGDLSIRIGLHSGPVYYAKEPILNKTNYFGSHVNRAARIEPITNPGNVYASEQFAALLMAGRQHDLECKYVGIIVLPKDFGTYPIYHIKRKTEIE